MGMDENPYKAPVKGISDARLARTAYVWTSICIAGALLAAKLNVVWHDPWCRPRLTPYNLLFELVCRRVVPILLLLAVGGISWLITSSWARHRWEIWLAVCLLVVAIYHVIGA
jgi:hypothetical protein